ncbi:MAG: ATP-binding protein [Treponema sp.]|nr:ATP-binding protein [Treponema sp.]
MGTKKVKAKALKRYIVANTFAIVMTIFLGGISLMDVVGGGNGITAAESTMLAIVPTAFLLLVFVLKATNDFSKLALFIPLVLFALNSIALSSNVQHSYFYLLACFFICAISCLYTNFVQTLLYIILQTALIAVLYVLGFPIAGYDVSLTALLGISFIFLSCCVFLIVIAKTATIDLKKVSEEANSFRTYLATTQNYLAMLDSSNRIVYVSKPMSNLARIEEPELTKGRPFIDLFPNRELRLFAYKMLGRRELHEDNWEFTLYRQKRYFKAVSSGIVEGSQGGNLVTMLDMTHLAERDEIAAMKDSLKIGIFFMDREFRIQDNYSRYLEELLADGDLKGKCFTDIVGASVTTKELDAVKDYFEMVFDRTFDQSTLQEINPLNELQYVDPEGQKKIFHCTFLTVELGAEDSLILVTIYDVTAKVELQERLQKEERKRQEEMSNLFELLQVEPATFKAFQEDVEYEFSRVDRILGNGKLSNQEILVEVYQSVHAIKSNAVTLGLKNFGSKVHEVESEIKRLRDYEGEVPFDDMLHLTIEIERLVKENEGFGVVLERINSFRVDGDVQTKSNESLLIESLSNAADKAATDLEKKVRFVAADIDPEAIEKGPRRVMKEVLMQLIRNSVVHGVEPPEERASKGKIETGTIRLSIKQSDQTILIKLGDDGRGIDFEKIREKAVRMNLVKEDEADNKNQLLKAIFAPGFSTADDEEGLHGGRGIGLNLVRDRVRDAKGTIKLQTEFGKGTVFNIMFPMGDAEVAEAMDKAS